MKRLSQKKEGKVAPEVLMLAAVPITIGGVIAYLYNPIILAGYILTVLALCIKPE